MIKRNKNNILVKFFIKNCISCCILNKVKNYYFNKIFLYFVSSFNTIPVPLTTALKGSSAM